MEMVKHPQISQDTKFAMSLQYLKKESRDGADFCMQINIRVQSFQQVDFHTSGIKGSYKVVLLLMGMIKNSLNT